ncbi:hypothetical protein MHW47_00075 [Streptomyces sp. OfavH-34-F]|uniref:hypothetical protein n=1 Tax=Streptomyces sp. OfavH-34-F TaxID=2917760 RepID=UPI001EF16D7C|nr:hypothetical protein [Streptomyces sp. OfavH-34-F]MCG7522851.1 hypothetical protein [Streptomyces sp. OfavH-34-F]
MPRAPGPDLLQRGAQPGAPVGSRRALREPSARMRRSNPSAPRSPATNFAIDRAGSTWPSGKTVTVRAVLRPV